MAHSNVVEGMLINTPFSHFKCEHCILGKQTHLLVLKVREDARTTTPFEGIYCTLICMALCQFSLALVACTS